MFKFKKTTQARGKYFTTHTLSMQLGDNESVIHVPYPFKTVHTVQFFGRTVIATHPFAHESLNKMISGGALKPRDILMYLMSDESHWLYDKRDWVATHAGTGARMNSTTWSLLELEGQLMSRHTQLLQHDDPAGRFQNLIDTAQARPIMPLFQYGSRLLELKAKAQALVEAAEVEA